MNRRESLRVLGLTTISAGIFVDACKPKDKEAKLDVAVDKDADAGRQDYEIERDKKLAGEKFFTDHEMATITVMADIIIPKDDRSGSASDAKVPEFIEFMVKDIPEHQVPMRGGLRWLDMQCLQQFNNTFRDCTAAQQIELVNGIAYPDDVKPGMQQGVAFFNRMRELTASGFFTSRMGIEDLGYMGNSPNKWEGVPMEVLRQYGLENV